VEAAQAGPLKRVLLIEDSSTMRQIFALALAGEPCALSTLSGGREALARARELRPDLIVADLSLDDVDGYEICREIRRDPELSRTPVLLLHGSSVKLDEARVREVQADQVLAKPFESDELLQTLHQLFAAA
jgi:CheY-like chemotaxis protein